jgi:hypothetical protein
MLELTFDELENHIDEISTATKIVEVEDEDSESLVLIIQQPKSRDRLFANLVYKQTYEEAVANGLPDTKQMREILEKRGIINEKDDKAIKRLKDQLEAQRALLVKTTKVKANRERIMKVIAGIEADLNKILLKRERNFGLTAESKANEEKLAYWCRRYVFKSEGELLWPTREEYNKGNYILRINIFNEYSRFVLGFSTELIRYIARSNLWRIRYVTALKCGTDLFGVPAVDFSADQTNLLYWSHFYQGIYEMMPDDQPSEAIIEDDAALDAYMENYYREMKNERAVKKSSKGGIDATREEQLIITPSNELHQDIEYDKPREAQRLKEKKEAKLYEERSPRKKRIR